MSGIINSVGSKSGIIGPRGFSGIGDEGSTDHVKIAEETASATWDYGSLTAEQAPIGSNVMMRFFSDGTATTYLNCCMYQKDAAGTYRKLVQFYGNNQNTGSHDSWVICPIIIPEHSDFGIYVAWVFQGSESAVLWYEGRLN